MKTKVAERSTPHYRGYHAAVGTDLEAVTSLAGEMLQMRPGSLARRRNAAPTQQVREHMLALENAPGNSLQHE